jgi:ribulose-phosphate 3-epimerase
MQPAIIEKIVALRKAHPELLIEVDGGITPETAARCIAAGADQLISGSYIFADENPAAALARLAGQ